LRFLVWFGLSSGNGNHNSQGRRGRGGAPVFRPVRIQNKMMQKGERCGVFFEDDENWKLKRAKRTKTPPIWLQEEDSHSESRGRSKHSGSEAAAATTTTTTSTTLWIL